MKVLIKQAKILDSASTFFEKVVDLLIEDGVITQIEPNISSFADEIIEAGELYLSNGWIDLKADFCEPGNEHKETLLSGSAAAERGGFTHVCVMPSTHPPVDNKAQVEYIKNKNQFSVVEIHPTGCLSAKHEGKELAEMFDMNQSGAVFFTDDQKHVSTGLLYRALLYVQNFDGKISVALGEKSLSNGGLVHEGLASTSTGLKAIPSIAEVIDIERNLRLVEYTNGQLHLSGLSTSEGVELVRQAKGKGLKITADVHVNQLIFNETAVLDFDSQFKVLPPYRTENDRLALWKGVVDGTIDAIVSDHRPAHQDDKEVEFDYAAFGNVTLETFFPALVSCKEFDLNAVIRALTFGPNKVLGKKNRTLEIGNKADITLFTLQEHTLYTFENQESLCFNTPFMNKRMNSRIVGVIHQGRLALTKNNANA